MSVSTPLTSPQPVSSPSRPWGRLGPALARRLRLLGARARHRHAQFGNGCDIRAGFRLTMTEGAAVQFGSQCVLDHGMTVESHGRLQVGDRTIFGHHCTLGVRESVIIGEDCLLAEMVSIRDHDHRFDLGLDIPVREQGFDCRPVRIGRNVWIGGKATVLKGVTIGDNAIIGANSVVTRDIPANAIAVGSPARVIRSRDGVAIVP